MGTLKIERKPLGGQSTWGAWYHVNVQKWRTLINWKKGTSRETKERGKTPSRTGNSAKKTLLKKQTQSKKKKPDFTRKEGHET